MNNTILSLVNKGILKNGSGIAIRGLSKSIDDEYMVRGILKKDDCIKFLIYNDNGQKLLIKDSAVLKVDGMDIQKLLSAYSLTNDIINVESKTNVEKTLLGKKKAKINGKEVDEGNAYCFHNDINEKYNNKIFIIRGVGTNISLVGQRGRPKKI